MKSIPPWAPDDRLPVLILTGFLGSGKTTLMNRLLKDPAFGKAAVIVNEFGDVGIDNFLIEKIDGNTVLLESGCVCCTVKNELIETMADMLGKRESGLLPCFQQLIVETTGLADPVPIVVALTTDPLIATHYSLQTIACAVDAVHYRPTLARYPEAIKQIALADTLIVTKTDIPGFDGRSALLDRLAELNPGAKINFAAEQNITPSTIMREGLYNAQTKNPDVAAWLNAEKYEKHPHGEISHDHADHGHHADDIEAFCLTWTKQMEPVELSRWLEKLNGLKGDALLRLKGIVNVRGFEGPFIVHGVQQMIHTPTVLASWPTEDHRSQVVFITRGLKRSEIERNFAFA
jgi:G3E family GTPase